MFVIEANKLSSAYYGGTCDLKWLAEVSVDAVEWVKAGIARIPALLSGIKKGITELVSRLKEGWNFFTSWFRDDPVGAVAGAGLVVASGVLLFMGGQALGAMVGGLSGLAALKGLAISGAIAGVNALLDNPLGKCVRFLVRGAQYLYNFDWNQSDAEFKKQQQASINSLYGVAGTALGTALGATVCGVLPGIAAVRMNLANTAAMWEIINDDIKLEVLSQFNALLNSAKRVLQENLFKETYMNVRRWIKGNSALRGYIKKVLPGADKAIEAWGDPNGKPFTFAKVVENAIDGIKDANQKAFVENAVEGFMETCTESLLSISYAL